MGIFTQLDQLTSGTTVQNRALHHLQRLATNKAPYISSLRTGSRLSKKWGSGLEFDQLREYSQGDDPRCIDWKASSRLNTIYTKQFVEDKDANCLIVIDLQDSMYFGSRKRYLSTLACYCAALLAWRWHRLGYAVAFTVINSIHTTDFQLTHKEYQLQRTLEQIARMHNNIRSHRARPALVSHLKPQQWQKFENMALVTSLLSIDGQLAKILAHRQTKKGRLLIGLEDPLWQELQNYELLSDGYHTLASSQLHSFSEIEARLQSDAGDLFKHIRLTKAATPENIFDIASRLQKA